MPESRPGRLIVTCRLCNHHAEFEVLVGVRAKTEEDTRAEIAGRFLRAENDFFQNHWQSAHPVQAGEIVLHVASIARLARVSAYHKRVLESRFEELTE